MNKLRKQITDLQSQIQSHINNINAGGCIHFTYYFSKRLHALGIEHKIVFGDCQPIDIRYNNFRSVGHVMVFIKDIGYIDGINIISNVKEKYGYLRHLKVSGQKLDRFRTEYDWNDTYETKQNNKVERLINKYIIDEENIGARIHSIHEKFRDSIGR